MKKILIFILTLCMSAFLGCSCGDNSDGPIVETLPPAPEVEATLSLDTSELSLLVGEEKLINAQVNNLEGYSLSFASNNEDVAFVDDSGKVTAYGEGTAVITATYTNGTKTKTATCNVAVGFANYVPFVEIEGGLQDVTQISLNDKLLVTPFISFNNLIFKDATYEITSLNEAIVEVNEEGELVAKGVGETQIVIKATWRNKTSEDYKTLTNTFTVKVINSVIFFANGSPLENVNLFTRDSFYGKNYDVKTAFVVSATVNGEAFAGEISVSVEDGNVASYASNEIQSKGFGETIANVTLTYNGESFGDTFKIKVERPIVEIEEEVTKFSTFSGMFKDSANGLKDTTLAEKFFESGKTIFDAYQYIEDGTIKTLTFKDGCVYDIESSNNDMAGTAKIILGTSTERYVLNLETYGQLFTTPEDLLYLVVNQEKKLIGYCELLNDIDATGLTFDHNEDLFSQAGFHGVFEGKGHVISNVTVVKNQGAKYGESLFGAIGASAVLRNFALYNLNCSESYFIAQSATDGHTIENVYINVSSNTTTPKGITNAMGSKNVYKAIVVDYLTSNENAGLTSDGIPNFALGHNGSQAEYSSFAGNVYRNTGFNTLRDETWTDVYVFSKLPALNYNNYDKVNANDLNAFEMPEGFDGTLNESGYTTSRATVIGYGANETLDLWGNEINDEAPFIDTNPSYSNDNDPYGSKRFFFNMRFNNLYRYESYEELAATKDEQGANQWDNFDSQYWLISNGVPYFKALYNTHINVGFYNSDNEYVEDVVFDEATDKFTVLFKDGGSLPGTPTVTIEANDYIEVVGNEIKVKTGANIPTVPHEYIVTASQEINGVNYIKTKVITVAKQINPIEDRTVFEANSGKLLTSAVEGEVLTFTVVDDNDMYSANVESGLVKNVIVRSDNAGNATLGLKVQLGDNTFEIKSTNGEFNGATVYVETSVDDYKFTNVEFVSKVLNSVEDLEYLSIDETSGNTAPYVILGGNIDAKGYKHSHAEEINSKNKLSYSFNGIFDGKGYTIANLNLTDNAGGLFGAFDYSAVVRNVGLYNVKAVNSPILALRAKLTSIMMVETENNGIKYDKPTGTQVYPHMQFKNIYVKLADGSKNVKGLISNFDNNHTYKMANVVVDFENAPAVTVEGGKVYENGVEVTDTIGILQASNNDKAFGFNSRFNPKFTNNYFITSYPLMYRSAELTSNDEYLYSGLDGYANKLSKTTKIGRVWGMARNSVAPEGVTKTVKDADATTNAFSYILDLRSEQYVTAQALKEANKDLSSFNAYWDTTSGAPVWKSVADVSITYEVKDENGVDVDDVLFDNKDDFFTITYQGATGAPTVSVEENDYIVADGNVVKVKQGVVLPIDPVEVEVSISQTISGKLYEHKIIVVIKLGIEEFDAHTYFDLSTGKLDTNLVSGELASLRIVNGEDEYVATVENGVVTDVNLKVIHPTLVEGVQSDEMIRINVGDNSFDLITDGSVMSTVEALISIGDEYYYFTNVEIVSKVIKTKEDLSVLAIVDNDDKTYDYFVLGDNVDAKGLNLTHSDKIKTAGINRLSYSFNGIFDGKGYTITNLNLTDNVGGLFGALDYKATIRNLGLYNVKAVNSPIFAESVQINSNKNVGLDEQGNVVEGTTTISSYIKFKNIYVHLAKGSKNVKGLVTTWSSNFYFESNNVVVDFTNAPTVTVVGGKVYENGVEVESGNAIGILEASTSDRAFAFNARNQGGFTNNYFITTYPLMYRSTALTPNDKYIYNGPDAYADRLSGATKIGRVWGMSRNGVAPEGVTKTVIDADETTNAFSYIVDVRSEQYATMQALKDANKDLTSFNEYWDISSGAPVWKSSIKASVEYKVVDVNGEEILDDVLFEKSSDQFTVTYVGAEEISGTPTLTVEENDYIVADGNVLKVKENVNLPIIKTEIKVTVSQTIYDKLYEKELIVAVKLLVEGIDRTGYLEDDGTIIADGLNVSDVGGVYYEFYDLEFEVKEDNLVVSLPTISEKLGEDVLVYVFDSSNEVEVLSLKYVTEYITTVAEMKEAVEIGDYSYLLKDGKYDGKWANEEFVDDYVPGSLYNTGYYVLGCDLDFTGSSIDHVAYETLDSSGQNSANPTFHQVRPFAGTFDGQGYALKNVTTKDNMSIFGALALKANIKNLAIVDYTFAYLWENGSNYYKNTVGLIANIDSLGSNYDNGGAVLEDIYVTVKAVNSASNMYQVKGVLLGAMQNARTELRNIVIEADIDATGYSTSRSTPILYQYANQHVYNVGSANYSSAKANAIENLIVISKDTTNSGQIFRFTRGGSVSNGLKNPAAVAYNDWYNNQTELAGVNYYPEYYYTDSEGNPTFIKPENYTGENNIVIRRYDDYTAFGNDTNTDKTSLNKFNSDMWVVSNGAVYYRGTYNDKIKAVAYNNENNLVDEIVFDEVTDSYTFGFSDNAILEGNVSITINGNVPCLVVNGNEITIEGIISGNESIEIVVSQEINGKTFTKTWTGVVTNERNIDKLVYFDASTGAFDNEEIEGTVESATVTYGEEDYTLTVNNGKIEGVTVENRTIAQSFTDISKHLIFVKVGVSDGAEVGFTIVDDGDFNGASAELRTVEGKVYKLSNVEFVSKVIKSQEDLATFKVTTNTDIDFGYYVLGNNINVVDNPETEGVNEAIAIAHTTFYNAAYEVANFNGVFDGKGYTISGLKTNSYGMFASVGAYAVIRNFALYNLDASNAPYFGFRLKTQTVNASKASSPTWLQAQFYPAIWMTDIYVKLSSNTTMPQGLYYEDYQTWYYKTANVIIDWQDAPTIKVENGVVYEGTTELTKNVGLYTAGGDDYAKMMGSRGVISTTYTISSYPLMYKQNGAIKTQADSNDKYYTIGFTQLSTSTAVDYTATRTFGFGRNITTMPYDGLVSMSTTNASTDIAVLVHADVYSYADNTAFASGLTSGNLKAFTDAGVWDTTNGYPIWKTLPQA